MAALDQPKRPTYEFDYARVGDAAPPVSVQLTPALVRPYLSYLSQLSYIDTSTAGGAYRDLASAELPVWLLLPLVRLYAPLRRREVMDERGAAYPDYATPAVRWHCRLKAAPRLGETITSTTWLQDKFMKRERHFLKWQVDGFAEDGRRSVAFEYVNLWDRGMPEDRLR